MHLKLLMGMVGRAGESVRQLPTGATMAASDKHLEALQALVKQFDKESGDVVIGRMIPEVAALMVTLGVQLDKAQRTVVFLTGILLILTVVLVGIGVVQFFDGPWLP